MKRLVSTVLALSLLGTAAASAQPYNGSYGNDGYGSGYGRSIQRDNDWNQNRYGNGGYGYSSNGWNQNRYGGYRGNYNNQRDYRYGYRSRNDNGALVGLGIGLFALAAIAASQHNADHRRNDGYYNGR